MGHPWRLFREGLSFLLVVVMAVARSVRQNGGLVALSGVLAVGLWIFVADTESETREGVLPLDLEVEPVAVPPDVALADKLATVRPRIRVDRDEWEKLTVVDFEVTVDLEGLRVGVHDLPVKVEALTSRGGLRVIDAEPLEIEVRLEPLFSESVPVVVEAEGQPLSGFTMGLPELEEETVLVIGAQERVDTVSRVVASLDVSGRSAPLEQAVRLEPRDQRGFLVQGVTVEPSVIAVTINIEPTLFSRTVVIVAEVQGAPLDGYNLVSVTVSPSTVTIFGLPSLIQEKAGVQTEAVDISGVSSSLVRAVSLELPAGANVSEEVSVIVTVRVEAASGQLVFLVPVMAAGLGEGLSLVGELPSVEVTLSGPLPTLFVVSPGDIVVILELSGLAAGEHTVEVMVTAPAGLAVDSVSREELQVQLEEPEAPQQGP